MNTTTSRGFIAVVAAPFAAAGIVAAGLGIAAVAHASTAPVVSAKSGMVLSKEFAAEQQEEQGGAADPIDLQRQQEAKQAASPNKQQHSQIMGNLKAEQQEQGALNKVESLENDQPAEPKAHVYAVKAPVHKKLGLMHAGYSQMGG
ncbi:MAG TPA: hypothetical protein VHT50_25040 [Mycobacterium sp.]|jgi:hypothetical protein|nr:hypothetical protein [Mycobacterium sp.]